MEKYTTSIEIEVPNDSVNEEPQESKSFRETFEDDDYDYEYEYEKSKKKKKDKPGIRFYVLNILLGMVIIVFGLFIAAKFLCTLSNYDYQGIANSDVDEIHKNIFSHEYCSNTIFAWGYNLVVKPEPIPFVKEVNVYLKDMNSVVVSVKEDEVFGLFKKGNQNVYFDSNGNVVEISRKEISGIPQITGITLSEVEDGKPLNISNSQKNIILNLIKYLGEGNIHPDIIDFEKDGSFGFYVESIYVDMGVNTEVREKCARLPRILPNLEGESGTLHLEEWGRENSDIIFEKSI